MYCNETPTLLGYNARGDNEFDDLSGNIKRQQDTVTKKHIASAYQNQKGKLGIYVHCEVSGKDTIKLGGQFWEKYRKMLSPFSVTIAPPTFAGSVAWQLANSTQQGQEHELGTQYTIKAKADP
ncbi:hypothetical protein [Tenacibaculum sp. SDUM215027]|uniref:hypothetical protein n=1 Tax=Tenacibaculum sp. SDUM215027 TaxID=3422596 RepID=UPI003D312E52